MKIFSLILGIFLIFGCTKKGPNMNEFAAADLPDVPSFSRIKPNIAVAGQPSREALKAAKEAGYRTVINLRPKGEWPFDEESLVKDLGMEYVQIPVTTPETFTFAKAKELQEILRNKKSYPILLHCGSSNRVGALFALSEFLEKKISAKKAVEIGKRAGLRSPALAERIQELITEK